MDTAQPTAVVESFVSDKDKALAAEFMANGYVIRPVDDRPALDAMRRQIVALVCEQLKLPLPNDDGQFLDHIQDRVPVARLNELRLAVYRAMNARAWFRPTYFALGRSIIEGLVGNELAMQNRVNLSIQMPNDDSSVLPIHADAFGGETPFQVVVWLPLVDCIRTKSMFILPYEQNRKILPLMNQFRDGGMAEAYERVKDQLIWLDVPYGTVLVFSPNQLHGNIVNAEPTSRWSMNCRLTGLFTPYTSHEKKLGSYYLPITMRPVSQIGLDYEPPGGFQE